ncbi:MAG: DUF6106 family protein [Eubacteriales bacterium]|nr:DUF6106 family protein [Eubacteriales bacterium]
MDVFVEKMVKRKKTATDYLLMILIAAAPFVISIGLLLVYIPKFTEIAVELLPFIFAGLCYLAYIIIRSRNIEYEYLVTNGELDIDIIISKRSRKRIFSGSSRDFDLIAPYANENHSSALGNVKSRINAVSNIKDRGIYFVIAYDKGSKVGVLFQPDQRMLEMFRKYIPGKVFTE